MAKAMFDEEDRSGAAAADRIPDEIMKVAQKLARFLLPLSIRSLNIRDNLGGFMKKFLKVLVPCVAFLSFGALRADAAVMTHDTMTDTNVKVEQDGTKVIKGADNSEIHIKPDGSRVIKTSDGTVIEKHPDGSKTVTKPDGTKVEVKPGEVMKNGADFKVDIKKQ